MKMSSFIIVLSILLVTSTCYAQQTIETMWRCGGCDQKDCKPFTMNLDSCTPICSPCTGACVTQHYKLTAVSPDMYTLTEYNSAGCVTVDSSVIVQSGSCKAGTHTCSRVYLASSAPVFVPSVLGLMVVLFVTLH